MLTSLAFMLERDSVEMTIVLVCLFSTALSTAILSSLFYNKKVKFYYENSLSDSVTGLYNYKAFTNRLNQEEARSKRAQAVFSLLLIDIDDFKDFNSKYGYEKADKMMLQLIAILKSELRKTDALFRYRNGDEFAVIAVDTDIEGAQKFANRIKQKVNLNKFILNNETLELNISVGVSSFKDGQSSMEAQAEQALIVDKKNKHK